MFKSKITEQIIKNMNQALLKEGIDLSKDYKKIQAMEYRFSMPGGDAYTLSLTLINGIATGEILVKRVMGKGTTKLFNEKGKI